MSSAVGKVAPFRHVTPESEERYTSCVPSVDLQAAAGTWSDEQEGLIEPGAPDAEWITWDTPTRFAKRMFVARVRGRSMEPLIPDGAYCLFRQVAMPSSPDRVALVRRAGTADPETGGQYTVKHYREEKGPRGEKRVVLQPTNPEFPPIVIKQGGKKEDIRVLAEVVEVLPR